LRVESRVDSLAVEGEAKNSVAAQIRLCNLGDAAIDLPGAIIRFWYTVDGAALPQVGMIYSDGSGLDAGLSTLDLEPWRVDADTVGVFTLSATAAIPAKTCTSEINFGIHAGTNWQMGYDNSNDWSYLPTTTFAVNDKITVDVGATRLWGAEPAPQP
jgi:hypothetical protein